MQATIDHIAREITQSYVETINEQEKVNSLLDHIRAQKKTLKSVIEGVERLSKLLAKISWSDDLTKSDEMLIKGVLAMGKDADKIFRQYYAEMRRQYAPKGLFKTEFAQLKIGIENHQEDILELDHIIFQLRKDDAFNSLSALVDEL